MNLENAAGPGVDAWLTDRLASWGIETLTDVQSRALDAGVADGRSLIVCAPTSSGKTLVGEIAVLTGLRAGMRAFYLVSHKALADQKYLDFVRRFDEEAAEPLASVGLNTGDRAEGDIDARLMVATYEKALGLIPTGQLSTENAVIIADELQIIGDPGRGPDIEALCAVLRKRRVRQFVALTATVENPEDLAGWLDCKVVRSFHCDVPLHQEIWYENRVHRTTFGQDEGEEVGRSAASAGDVLGVVAELLRLDRGPVLVFTETRREAANYATAFGQRRPRVSDGIALAGELDLYSEPTESSEQLRQNAEKRVTFHTADLSAQERQVIEAAFCDSKFEVCFATSTLAAGVNFPFRSVVFPKLTYQHGGRGGTQILRADYRNMSGRAGRLGLHPDGYAILLPRNRVELAHANQIVRPDNDRLVSQLINLSLRKTILMLVSSQLVSSLDEVMSFFENTLYWYQTLQRNPARLADLSREAAEAIRWLSETELLHEEDGTLLITPLGRGAALSGLLPATAVQFASMLRHIVPALTASFDDRADGLIYAACASDEFRAERPSRFLPYATQAKAEALGFWSVRKLPIDLDRADLQLAQSAQALAHYAEGLAERKIAFATGVSSGMVHRLAIDIAWVLDGLHKLSCIPDLGCPQTVSNKIAMLARRVRWGAPAEALDVMRVAERHRVPGFGRQRAMALLAQGITTLHDLLATAKDKLVGILRSDRRTQALLDAASSTVGLGPDRLATAHARLAKMLGIEKIVEACNRDLGTAYEKAIADLLQVESTWVVTVLDDGQRQNVPDLLVGLNGLDILIECKTCTTSPPLIKKEEAWAVLQKSADFDGAMRRVTLGKPAFDEMSLKARVLLSALKASATPAAQEGTGHEAAAIALAEEGALP